MPIWLVSMIQCPLGDVTGAEDYTKNANRLVAVRALPTVGDETFQAQFAAITAVDHDGNSETTDEQVKWYFQVYAVTTEPGDGANAKTLRSRSYSREASATAEARESVDLLTAPMVTATARDTDNGTALEEKIDLTITTSGAQQKAYRIDYSDDGGLTWKERQRDTRFTGFSLDRRYSDSRGLEYDDMRHYRVFAIGSNWRTGVGLASTLQVGSTAISVAPDAPTNVVASAPNLRTIEVSWRAPEDDGGQDISNYRYQYAKDDGDGIADDGDWANTNRGNRSEVMSTGDADRSYTVELAATAALDPDATYYIRVLAVNVDPITGTDVERPVFNVLAIEADNWSDGAKFSSGAATAPGTVAGLTSELATDTSGDAKGLLLLWNKPETGSDPATYEIERKVDDGEFEDWRSDAAAWEATSTSYTDPEEPEADEQRVYRVRAVNKAGESAWQMVYYPRNPAADHTHEPTAPTNVMASSDAAGELMLTWEGGANADSYPAHRSEHGGHL